MLWRIICPVFMLCTTPDSRKQLFSSKRMDAFNPWLQHDAAFMW